MLSFHFKKKNISISFFFNWQKKYIRKVLSSKKRARTTGVLFWSFRNSKNFCNQWAEFQELHQSTNRVLRKIVYFQSSFLIWNSLILIFLTWTTERHRNSHKSAVFSSKCDRKNEKAEEQQHNCQNKLKIIIKTQETIERSAKWPFPSPKNIRDYSIYNEFIINILSVSWVGGTLLMLKKNPLGKFYYSSFSFKWCIFCVPRGDQIGI